VRANEMRWNRMRFHLISFRSNGNHRSCGRAVRRRGDY
jgi:hypothetical protein